MAKDSFIALGREYESCGPCGSSKKGEKRISYPSLYISGVKGLDLDTGEITFTAKGKVVSVSKRDKDDNPDTKGEEYSCEIEVHSISAPGAKPDGSEDGLDKALSKIEKSKVAKEAAEEGESEEEEATEMMTGDDDDE